MALDTEMTKCMKTGKSLVDCRKLLTKPSQKKATTSPKKQRYVQRLLWVAYQDDGSWVERWDREGEEQTAPPGTTRQFHCHTLYPPLVDHLLVIPPGAQFWRGIR